MDGMGSKRLLRCRCGSGRGKVSFAGIQSQVLSDEKCSSSLKQTRLHLNEWWSATKIFESAEETRCIHALRVVAPLGAHPTLDDLMKIRMMTPIHPINCEPAMKNMSKPLLTCTMIRSLGASLICSMVRHRGSRRDIHPEARWHPQKTWVMPSRGAYAHGARISACQRQDLHRHLPPLPKAETDLQLDDGQVDDRLSASNSMDIMN